MPDLVAERSSRSGGYAEVPNSRDPADWLTLPQAACELNVSVSTVRRMIRDGRLRNRIVPRRGGFAYLIYAPGNRHSAPGAPHDCAATGGALANGHNAARERAATVPRPTPYQRREAEIGRTRDAHEAEIRRLEQQVESLSHALSRALRVKQVSLPPGIGGESGAVDPYARYRWLVRRKKWWPW